MTQNTLSKCVPFSQKLRACEPCSLQKCQISAKTRVFQRKVVLLQKVENTDERLCTNGGCAGRVGLIYKKQKRGSSSCKKMLRSFQAWRNL
jgi:hypothetical protein